MWHLTWWFIVLVARESVVSMFSMTIPDLSSLLTTYGYWAVFACIAIESTGIPFPGETMLLVASIYAGTTHQLSLPLVIAAAASGAILGDNLGFWAGREGGHRLLRRNARFLRLDERKLKLGLYLFMRHGGKVVFFGRFVALLRMWAASLSGTNRMGWKRFLLFNAASGMLWATLYGAGGYLLGDNVHRLTGPIGVVAVVLAVLALLAFLVFVRRNERRLGEVAERALPGPLEGYHTSTGARRGRLAQDCTSLTGRVVPVPGKQPRFLQVHTAQERGKRCWLKSSLVYAGMMALGVLACACGVYLHVAIHYHERAYAFLALGALLFLAGVVGRYSGVDQQLIRRLSTPLCYGVLVLGTLASLAGMWVWSARTHSSVLTIPAVGLEKLRAHEHDLVLVAGGTLFLLVASAGIVMILLSVQAGKKKILL